MALQHAVIFLCVAFAIIAAATRRSAAAALFLGAAGFGIACGLSVGQIGKSFGNGFGAAAAGPGLAVVAAALIGAMAQASGATSWLSAASLRRPGLASGVTPLAGLVAGTGASPAAAFAVLSPLAGATGANPYRLALAIAAGHGLLLPSPVVLAATAILAADWRLVLGFGLPCALLVVWIAHWRGAVPSVTFRQPEPPGPAVAARARGLAAAALVSLSAALIGLIIVQSLGDIASEPFGGGGAREFLLALGRPFILLLLGGAGMAAVTRPAALVGLADAAIGRAAPLVLLLGAAGGLQALAQDSRMSDTLGETVAAWHLGLFVPFLVAACLKILLGSSSVAAISAAGLLQPALAGLGLDDATGHACAALAVGAGAVAGTHVNDSLFWIVNENAPLRASRCAVWLCGGTILQGVASVAVLMALRALAGIR